MSAELEPKDVLVVWVPGVPQPGGSKRGFLIPNTKRIVITEDNKRSKDWRASVAQVVSEVVTAPLHGPLEVIFEFYLPRPQGHFGSGRNAAQLKESAPRWHSIRPDYTKLVRSTEDALKGIAWLDDSQIASQRGTKVYGDRCGCRITIRSLEQRTGPSDRQAPLFEIQPVEAPPPKKADLNAVSTLGGELP